MADYHSLLATEIARLPHSTPEARRQLYERMRQLLFAQLQNTRPPLSTADIERQLASFDSAAAQIEVELTVDAALKTSPTGSGAITPGARDETTSAVPSASPPQGMQDRIAEKPKPAVVLAIGLRAHILNNSLKSIFLIIGFPFVLPFVVFCVVFIPLVSFGSLQAFHTARVASVITLIATLGTTLVWLPIAYFINQWVIDRATGARLLTRSDDVRVWKLLEDLCSRCGMRMPILRVIETDELNAHASGLSDATYSVTVTEGLMATLSDAELKAVLAHELTHILNRDVRLTVVAAILVGVVPIMETIFVRGFWYLMNGFAKIYEVVFTIMPLPGAVLLTKFAYGMCFVAGKGFALVVGVISHLCTLLLNFSLSRRREFMADAGAVTITNDPDAMIDALRKISGHSDIPAALANVREMFFDNPRLIGFEGLFATHPTIQARIDALLPYARAASNGQSTKLSAAGGRWGDKAADLIGTGLLLGAIGTMSYLILTASSNVSGVYPNPESRAFLPHVYPNPPKGLSVTYELAPPTAPAPPRLSVAVPSRPSFDCEKATYADEKAICATPSLAERDLLTTQAFEQAKAIPSSHKAALQAARKFIAARRACKGGVNCIADRQSAVLNVFRSLGATVQEAQ